MVMTRNKFKKMDYMKLKKLYDDLDPKDRGHGDGLQMYKTLRRKMSKAKQTLSFKDRASSMSFGQKDLVAQDKGPRNAEGRELDALKARRERRRTAGRGK